MSALFISGLFIAIFSCCSSFPGMFNERHVIYSHIDMNYVCSTSYVIAYSLLEIPLCFISAYLLYYINRILSTLLLYPLVDFKLEFEAVIYYTLSFTLVVLFSTYLGQLLSYITPSLQVYLVIYRYLYYLVLEFYH